jgi:hypothetical protein
MRNQILFFFVFCSGISLGQTEQKLLTRYPSGIRLTSHSSVLFDGNITSANSFDVIAYTDYHTRISSCLSPFLILAEPVPHNLLMAHKYVRLVPADNSFAAQFSLNPPESTTDEDYSTLDKTHYSSLFVDSNTPVTSTSPPPKVKSAVALLCIMAYQVVTADHNWGGYSTTKE